jgi:ribonucleotide monophosphatase NagD (HAD superfamily)
VTAILVYSGETKPEELETSEIQPDLAFASLGELAEYI